MQHGVLSQQIPSMGYTMPVLTPDLAAAIVEAQAQVESARKDRHSPGEGGYDYASAEEIIATAKPALRAAGLAVLPLTYSLEATAPAAERSMGGLDVVRQLRLLHRSGAYVEWMVRWPVHLHGKARDKAVAGALTSMLGYVLRDLLQIPRGLKGEEGMDERRDDGEAKRQAPTPPRTGQTIHCGERPSWMRDTVRPPAEPVDMDALGDQMADALGVTIPDQAALDEDHRRAAANNPALVGCRHCNYVHMPRLSCADAERLNLREPRGASGPGALPGPAHTDDSGAAQPPTPLSAPESSTPSTTDAPPAPGPVPPPSAAEETSSPAPGASDSPGQGASPEPGGPCDGFEAQGNVGASTWWCARCDYHEGDHEPAPDRPSGEPEYRCSSCGETFVEVEGEVCGLCAETPSRCAECDAPLAADSTTCPDPECRSHPCDECHGQGYYYLTPDGGKPERRECVCMEDDDTPEGWCGRVGAPSVRCTTCDRTKAPRGRSVSPETPMCDDDCPGYREEPKPDQLWPGERCAPPLCQHGGRLVDPSPAQVAVVSHVAEDVAQARKDRAARWLSCVARTARDTRGVCAECGNDVEGGDRYREGVAPAPDGRPIRRRSNKPQGIAHTACVEQLAQGEDPRAQEETTS